MRIRQHTGNVDIDISDARLQRNLRECQKVLNLQIAADCDPLIPFQQGQLRNSLVYPEGVYGGELEWNAPHAHYQYESIVYSPNIPIKDSAGNITGWFSPPGQKKQPTNRTLQYHTPGTTGHWFEVAKERHKQEWIDLVKRTAGKE
ncbi:MAG: minor capsid protein [Lachnospiraceae bacterium]|nr:minor capsid protein [Lachnospiraceae bacterium]